MSYQIELSSKAHRQYKKLNTFLRKAFKKEIEPLYTNPADYPKLSGKFSNLRKLEMNIQGNSYRVVFTVIEEKKKVVIAFIGTRENFYKRLQQYLS
jgi:mRNA-degrading endonuclease RelE of RelBE toxin-antitoxin system